MIHFQRQFSKKTKLALSIATAVMLSLAWCGASCITLFVAFVPLMLISAQYGSSWRDSLSMLGWATLSFVLWNAFTIWWVWIATPIGPIVATVVSTWWNLVAFMLFHVASKLAPKVVAYLLFVAGWIATEYIYTYAPAMSFPWLVLGNGFALDTWAVQWYEYTGVFGGSLWVLIVNVLAFESLLTMRKRVWVATTLAIVVPMAVSLVLYGVYSPEGKRYTSLDEVRVSVVQPNVPCYEKFHSDTKWQQDNIFRELEKADSLARAEGGAADFILLPETSLAEMSKPGPLMISSMLSRLSSFLRVRNPKALIVAGTETMRYYGRTKGSATARRRNGAYIDIFNSSVGVDSLEMVQVHNKGKLVIGVETTPAWLREAEIFSVDLGGTMGQLGIGQTTEPFVHNDIRIAPAICYEALYGQYMGGFVRHGAQLLGVVSNDGWWGNTLGHRYLFAFCRLRAIENRRDVARSANTGTSGFITMRGDDVATLGWDVRGSLSTNLRLNSATTYYARCGDYIGRIALYIAALCLLYCVAYVAKRRFYLN